MTRLSGCSLAVVLLRPRGRDGKTIERVKACDRGFIFMYVRMSTSISISFTCGEGASHIKHTSASKHLHWSCFMEEKDFKHKLIYRMTKTSIQAYCLKTTGISYDDIRLFKNALFMYWHLRSEIPLILQSVRFQSPRLFDLMCQYVLYQSRLLRATLILPICRVFLCAAGDKAQGKTCTLLPPSLPPFSLLAGAFEK